MWEIPIFAAEKKDGLDHLVRSNASIAYCSPAKTVKPDKVEIIKSFYDKTTASANKDQMDLFYLDTILVTAGTMNLNDDIFLREPTWAARHTPEDKPFNYGHDQLDIIGHITSNCAVDSDYKVIAEDSTIDDLPDKFHILTSAVIYKTWADKDQHERIQKIIAEIGEDKWFVSMECLFRGFDYGFYDTKGECRIVARNEDTAFLTKHLRAYGGTGKYKGDRIGRVVSNLVFSGKGLVENPANPESIIFNNVASFKSTFANLGYIKSCEVDDNSNNTQEIIDMPVDEKTIAELEKRLEASEAENKKLVAKLEDVQAQSAKASEDKINTLTVALDDEKEKSKKAEEKAAKAEAELDQAQKDLVVAKSDNEALKKTQDEFKKAGKVAKAGLSDEAAEQFLKDWAEASEEMFDKALTLAQKANAGAGSFDKPDTVKKVAEVKPGDDSGAQKVNSGSTPVATAESVLEGAEEDKASAAVVANVTTDVETSRASLSNFLEKSLANVKSRKRK